MTTNRTRAEQILAKYHLHTYGGGSSEYEDGLLLAIEQALDEAGKAAYERGQRDALLAKDVTVYGEAHMMDGKRVDPKDIYYDPESLHKGTLAGLEMAAGIARENSDLNENIADSACDCHEQIRAKAKELGAEK